MAIFYQLPPLLLHILGLKAMFLDLLPQLLMLLQELLSPCQVHSQLL